MGAKFILKIKFLRLFYVKYHSDMGHWSLKKVFCCCFFTFPDWEKTDMELGKKVVIFHWAWGRNSATRERQKRVRNIDV